MADKILGPTGSPRRRRFLGIPIALVVLVSLLVVAGAQAVHDETFQLDGNVLASSTTEVPSGNVQQFDWDSLFNADGSTKGTLPSGFEDARLDRDFQTSQAGAFLTADGSTFSTGSKDTLPISGWQCNLDNNVNSKIDVMNAYAATYTDASGDEFLYFGLERNVNTGDANVGFWFLQSEVGCESTGASVTFSGEHQDGDLLIVSAFSNGGTVSTINVYRWDRPDPDLPGSLNTTPVAAGVDCRSVTTGINDLACGAANTTAITTPWLTAAKTTVGNSLPTAQFFEGGLNLTDANLGGKCFSTFLGNTRSSTSLTATLFDFSSGTLGSCGSSMTTDASANELDLGDSVTDTATLTVSGADIAPTGNVDFYVCGPSAGISSCDADGEFLSSEDLADATGTPPEYSVTSDAFTPVEAGDYCFFATYAGDSNYPAASVTDFSDECFTVNPNQPAIETNATAGPVSLGTAIDDVASLSGTADQPDGDPAGGTITFTAYGPHDDTTTCTTVAYTSVVNVNGDGDYTASDGTGGVFTPTTAGTYNWIAVYSGDSPNTLGVSGACGDANEGSVVSPSQPDIETNATAGPVPLGSAIDDVASLSGTADQPDGDPAGGTITFTAYGPHSDTTTCTTVAYTSVVNVNGDGDYTASTGTGGVFTPTEGGTYNWIAVYSGDSPNTLGVSGACGDANEGSVVISLQPTISTAQSFVPNDEATITVAAGAGDLAGSVRFRLYETADCTGATLIDQTVPVSGASPQTVGTTNTTAITTTSLTLSWLVEYTSTNTGHKNVTSTCATENSSLTIDNG